MNFEKFLRTPFFTEHLPWLFLIIKRLNDISRNRSFLIGEVGKIVRLLLLSKPTNTESDSIFTALKSVKTYPRLTMRNNQLQALTLVHVHIKILGNINLADVANQFVNRSDSYKQIFRHFSQNCTFHIFIFPINCIKMWSCVTFFHSLNRFPQTNDDCISTSSN